MSDNQYYDALAATVRFKDITSSAHNRALLHRIRNQDPATKHLCISSAENMGDGKFVVREEDDLGWLGYFIGKNITLTALEIAHLPGGSEQVVSFFKGVSRNKTIKTAEFRGDGIADEGEGLSAINMPQVTSIKVYFQPRRDSARSFAMGLRRCKSLESYYGRLTAEIIDALGELPLIKSITSYYNEDELNDDTDNLGKEGCIALEKLVRNATRLTDLFLGGVGIGDEGMKSLAAGLVHNTSLKDCYLSNNNIWDAGVKSLAASLADNIAMQELYLCRNHIGDEGLTFLASSLVHNHGVRKLDVSDNSIGDKGLTALATSLASNRTLRDLYLCRNNIGDTGLVALAESLLQNRTLSTLDISGNTAITEVGLSVLSRVLRSPKCKLESLSLDGLDVGGAVVELLGSTLSINKSIVSLELSCGVGSIGLDNDGLRVLAAGLRDNDTLRALDLSGNTAINATGLSHLKQYFWSESCALEALWLYSIYLGDAGAFALADALAHNKSLKQLLVLNVSGITEVGWNAFSKLLCDPTSASSIYLSHHTLEMFCWEGPNQGHANLLFLLGLSINKVCNSRIVAAKLKILYFFPDLDMTPLFPWNLKFLPLLKDWFRTITFSRSTRSSTSYTVEDLLAASIRGKELSVIYKFVSGMPGLVVRDYRRFLDQQLQMIQATACMKEVQDHEEY